MNIYIIIYKSENWNEIGGVHKTLEQAKKEIDNFKSLYNSGKNIIDISIIQRDLNE